MAKLENYLKTLQHELSITDRVLKEFPADQMDFKPHERSNTAKQLVWTFAIEMRLVRIAVESGEGRGFAPPPETWEEVIQGYADAREELVRTIAGKTDETLPKSMRFFVAPKQIGDFPTMEFLWFMLHDHIHHRGQLSVYLRMVGGRVPSIYGPSADEKWN